MRRKNKKTIEKLWKWLEDTFRDINMKLDHILFRLREKDQRIYQDTEEMRVTESDDDDFKDT